jgi:hypothetical protein
MIGTIFKPAYMQMKDASFKSSNFFSILIEGNGDANTFPIFSNTYYLFVKILYMHVSRSPYYHIVI